MCFCVHVNLPFVCTTVDASALCAEDTHIGHILHEIKIRKVHREAGNN